MQAEWLQIFVESSLTPRRDSAVQDAEGQLGRDPDILQIFSMSLLMEQGQLGCDACVMSCKSGKISGPLEPFKTEGYS